MCMNFVVFISGNKCENDLSRNIYGHFWCREERGTFAIQFYDANFGPGTSIDVLICRIYCYA